MTKSQKKDLVKILISAALFIIAELVPKAWPLFLVSYAIVGYGPIFSAVKNISRGQIFDENFLMTIATAGALALRQWDEAVAVMLFYAVGELFEDYAVNRSRNSIKDLMDIRPDYAVKLNDGTEETVDPYDVMPGDIIIVKPGEKVPLDGIVTEGTGTLDTSALTGESLPKDISPGMEITSGFVNLTGLLKIEVTAPFEESTVSKILDLVENSGSRKAKVEKFITRFARYYTPAVVFAAIALAIIPPLLFNGQWQDWIYRALLFLVISCPCALVISVPLAFFGGVGTASRNGILVKGSNYLEALANVEEIVFDKTGTITTGNFEVTDGCSPELLELAAHIESYSAHPISQSIIKAYGKEPDKNRIGKVEEIPGEGIWAEVDGRKYYAGNDKLMAKIGAALTDTSSPHTTVHIAAEDKYLGTIEIADVVKDNAREAISELKSLGVKKTVMLSGDTEEIAAEVSGKTGIDEYHGRLLPQDKVDLFEKMAEKADGHIAFVGDGINDAPTLARADVGIAMGGAGSQAAIEAADIAIMDDDISKIGRIIKIARKTITIAKENVVFALSIKFIVLILGALGFANMWMAVFADVGVAILAILNSMRMLIRHKN